MAAENGREYWHWETKIGWPRNVPFRSLKALLRMQFLAQTFRSQNIWCHLLLLNHHSFILPQSFSRAMTSDLLYYLLRNIIWKSCVAPDACKLWFVKFPFSQASLHIFFTLSLSAYFPRGCAEYQGPSSLYLSSGRQYIMSVSLAFLGILLKYMSKSETRHHWPAVGFLKIETSLLSTCNWKKPPFLFFDPCSM